MGAIPILPSPPVGSGELPSPAASGGLPSPPALSGERRRSTGQVDYWQEFINGFKGSSSDAFFVLSNAVGLVDSAAAKVSAATGMPVAEALKEVKTDLRSVAHGLQPTAEDFADPEGLAEKMMVSLARVGGGLVPSALLYGGATVATRSPARGMALVEGMREIDKGAWEAAVAGVRGYGVGSLMQASSYFPSMSKRAITGGSVMAAQAFLAGRSREDILIEGIIGAGMSSALRARRKPEPVVRGARGDAAPELALAPQPEVRTLKSGVTIREPAKGLRAGISPSVIFERMPKTLRAIEKAIEAETAIRHGVDQNLGISEKAFRSVPASKRSSLISALDDETVTVLDLPPGMNAKQRGAYRDIRTVLEGYRRFTIETKRILGQEVDDAFGKPQGYWPREFRGPWAVFGDGKPVPIGWRQASRGKAKKVANEWQRLNPDAKVEITYLDNIIPNVRGAVKGEKYWAHIQQRKVNLAGWVDDESALYNYIREAERYNHISRLRPLIEEAKSELAGVFGENSFQAKLFNGWASTMEGQAGTVVRGVNKLWAKAGGSPNVAQRGLGFLQGLEATLKLGYSPVSAMNNLFQIMVGTLPVLGKKYTQRGIRGYVSGKYDWLIDDLKIRDQAGRAELRYVKEYLRIYRPDMPRKLSDIPKFAGETAGLGWNGLTSLGMIMFNGTESANRGVTAIGSYIRAVDQGKNHQQSVHMAQQAVRRTQFHYGVADSPIMFAGPFTRTIFQFKTFMLKEMEFMLGLTRKGDMAGRFDPRSKELTRFVGMSLASVGIVGIPGAEMLDYAWKKLWGHSLFEEWMNEHPQISRGALGAAFQVDTRMMGFSDWPFDPNWVGTTEFTGPIVSDFFNLASIGMSHEGRDRELATKRFWQGASPAARRIHQSFLSQASNRNEVRTSRGRLLMSDVELSEKLLTAMGWKPLREAVARGKVGVEIEEQRRLNSLRGYYIDKLNEAIDASDSVRFDELAREAFGRGLRITTRSLSSSRRAKAKNILLELEERRRGLEVEP